MKTKGTLKGAGMRIKRAAVLFAFLMNVAPEYATADDGGGEYRKGLFDTPFGVIELEYKVIDGKSIFQGDIILPAEVQQSGGKGVRSSAVVASLGRRWPHGIVYIEDNALARDSRVTAAIREWTNKTQLRFVVGATTGNRIRFEAGDAGTCRSQIGMQTGVQIIEFGAECGVSTAIHEIGHAIGLFHEQNRSDRGSFVRVNDGANGTIDCIQDGMKPEFQMFNSSEYNVGRYDTGSIMHYRSDAFLNRSKAGCTATITRLDGTLIPEPTALSSGDIAGVQSLYLAWTSVRQPARKFETSFPTVWRPSTGTWYMGRNGAEQQWGAPTDVPVPGYYTPGAYFPDYAVWRPSTGEWFIQPVFVGFAFPTTVTQWGKVGDVPVPGDYDGDGLTDVAVWRPSEGKWYVIPSHLGRTGNYAVQWGTAGDVPVPADYDGDGRTDMAVWRPSTGEWHVIPSRLGRAQSYGVQWGTMGDIPVPGDYDGDGRIDVAVWRTSDLRWHVRQSSNDFKYSVRWGEDGDVPVPGDFDGDGRTDFAIWRPSDGLWWVRNSSTGGTVTQWGTLGDVPLP